MWCLQFEIIQLLLKECNKIEGHQQQVKHLKYFVKILSLSDPIMLVWLMYMSTRVTCVWWNRTLSCWQCKRMVLQYVPLVLVNGEKFLEKNDVCAMIQACDAGKRKALNLFSARKLVRDAWSSRKRAYTNQVVVGMEKTKWWQLVHMVIIIEILGNTLCEGDDTIIMCTYLCCYLNSESNAMITFLCTCCWEYEVLYSYSVLEYNYF